MQRFLFPREIFLGKQKVVTPLAILIGHLLVPAVALQKAMHAVVPRQAAAQEILSESACQCSSGRP